MNEIGNKRLYKHMTEPVFNKKGGPIKQIIIKKYGTKNNNISLNKRNKNNSKIEEKSFLNKSAILNRFEHEEIPKTKININSINFNKNRDSKMKYNSIFNTTIIKPAIVQQSILKPIIMPVNILTSGNLNEEFFIQKIINNSSQTNNIQKDNQIKKNTQIYKKKNINKNINENIEKKENINPNSFGNNGKRKIIIQKNIKHKNDKVNKENDKRKNILLLNPQPKDKDTLIIQKLDKNNSLKLKIANRKKFQTFEPKIKEENILNEKLNEIKDNSNNKDSRQINDLRKSMKPIEKINNITVNNTLKQTYKEMIKCKTIIVGLNNQIKINKEIGPRDSIRFKDN